MVFSRNSAVGLPGVTVGMNEPFSFRLLAISFGWNIIDVQKNAKKKISTVKLATNQKPRSPPNESSSQPPKLVPEKAVPIALGISSSAEPKMMGITFAWFSLNGR